MTEKQCFDSSSRLLSLEETLSFIMGFLPVFGITRVANITGLDRIGLPVVSAIRPNSKSLSVSQGKGLSLNGAKVSAIMEAVEGYHAENIHLPSLFMPFEDLELKAEVADLSGLPRKAHEQFNPAEKLLWLSAIDLLNEKTVCVPYDCVTADLEVHNCPRSVFLPDSTGLASGNSIIEAQIHAICESIERDALVMFWSKSVQEQNNHQVDLQTINDNQCVAIFDKLDKEKIDCAVWDITTDIDVPTYLCKVFEREFRPDRSVRPTFGSGTHTKPAIALLRAITEAIQSRATFISGARDDQYRKIYQSSLTNTFHASFQTSPPYGEGMRFGTHPDYSFDSQKENLSWLLAKLEKAGLEQVLSTDLTRSEFGIPVCKVMIPHLETVNGTDLRAAGKRILCH